MSTIVTHLRWDMEAPAVFCGLRQVNDPGVSMMPQHIINILHYLTHLWYLLIDICCETRRHRRVIAIHSVREIAVDVASDSQMVAVQNYWLHVFSTCSDATTHMDGRGRSFIVTVILLWRNISQPKNERKNEWVGSVIPFLGVELGKKIFLSFGPHTYRATASFRYAYTMHEWSLTIFV